MFVEPIEEAQAKTVLAADKQTDIELKGEKAKMNYKDYYDKLFQ